MSAADDEVMKDDAPVKTLDDEDIVLLKNWVRIRQELLWRAFSFLRCGFVALLVSDFGRFSAALVPEKVCCFLFLYDLFLLFLGTRASVALVSSLSLLLVLFFFASSPALSVALFST